MAHLVAEEYHWCYLDPSCDASTWGDHFELCNGMKQSPINIVTTGVTQLSETTPLSFTKYDEVRQSDYFGLSAINP